MEYGRTKGRGILPTPQPAEASLQHEDQATLGSQDGVKAARTGLPGVSMPAPPVVAGSSGQAVVSHRGGRVRGGAGRAWWALAAVLAVQAILSARLLGADTAFQDEALYLWAGHLEWARLLHGTPLPPFPAYFSGAPVLYPPIGALADSLGGLAAARLLSLIFMLGATTLLWAATRRLHGPRAAFFAAALFAILGPTLHLGAFATYDSLALLLLATAAWCTIRAASRTDATAWMIAAAAALTLANATAYSTVLFDPVIIALALLTAIPSPGGKQAAARAAILTTLTAVLLTAALLAGGSTYAGGFTRTTLDRIAGTGTPLTVLADAWSWTGIIIITAAIGTTISWTRRSHPATTTLLAVLTAAALLGPLEQARLHTTASLSKHVGLGAWFAAIAAGYAADKLITAAPPGRLRALTTAATITALAFPLALGATQSRTFATSWPNATSYTAILGPLTTRTTGRLLVEDPSIAEYYLATTTWQRWSSTRNIILPNSQSTAGPATSAGITGAGNPGVFAEFITEGYFTLVALNFADTTTLDHHIAADLRQNHHYHIIDVIPYGTGTYIIWRYEPKT
jgi:hypothetical protein